VGESRLFLVARADGMIWPMTAGAISELVGRGEEALASGDWEGAREAFQQAADREATADALDGLGRAVWWLGHVDQAIDCRERAYAAIRKGGDPARAAAIALWLAREYLEAIGNEPASNGWVTRAEGLIRDRDPGPVHGWLELTRGSRETAPSAMHRHADAALEIARRFDAADLEASALALRGRALLLEGDTDAGVAALDEAMTAITSGEVADPLVFGDVCCVVTLACEEAAELGRLMRWNEVVDRYLSRHLHGALLSFCGTCGAEFFQAKGDMEMAERCLVEALKALEGTGHRSRCIHPAAKLAEIRVLQGRIEDAERLLSGYEDLPESLSGSVAVHRARGEHAVAAALLLRRLNRMADTVAAAPLLATLVEVQLEQGDLASAGTSRDRIEAIADRTGHPRVRATASLAAGRVALAAGEPSAQSHLERALEGYLGLELPIDAARARLELARALRDLEPDLASWEARMALETLERLGATREADQAAALLRELGGPARTGPKGIGLLSRREVEVLRLLGEGLTNAEIAARLFISTKTAGNHVSNVLSKLHLRSRQEAAAYAVRYAGSSSPTSG
jgi:DNA-binding CsgD family transcriptional regulator